MSTIERLHGYLADLDCDAKPEHPNGDAAAASPAAGAATANPSPPAAAAATADPSAPAAATTNERLAPSPSHPPDVGDSPDHFKIRMATQKMPIKAHREFLKEYGKCLAQARAKAQATKYPVGGQEYPSAVRLQYRGDGSLPDEAYPVLVASLWVRVHSPYTDLRFYIKQLPPGVSLNKNDDYIFEVHSPSDTSDKDGALPLLVIRDAPGFKGASTRQPASVAATSPGTKRGAAQAAAASISSQLRGDGGGSGLAKKPRLLSPVPLASPPRDFLTRPDLPIPNAKLSPANGGIMAKAAHRKPLGADARRATAQERQVAVVQQAAAAQGQLEVAATPWPQAPSEANLPVVFLGLLNALEALGADEVTKWRFWQWALDGRGVVPWCERRWYCWQDAAADPDALKVAQEVFAKQDALLEQQSPGAADAATLAIAAAAPTLPPPPPMPAVCDPAAPATGSAGFQHKAALSTYATSAVKALAGAGLLSSAQRNAIFNAMDLNDICVDHMRQYVAGVLHPAWQAGDVLRMLWGLLCVVSPAVEDVAGNGC